MWASLRARTSLLLTPIGESAWVVFCFVLVASGASLFFYGGPSDIQAWAETAVGQVSVGGIIYTLAVIAVVAPFLLRKGKGWQYVARLLGVTKKPSIDILWTPLLVWLGYMAATMAVALVVSYALPWVDQDQAQEVGFDNLKNWFEYVAAFVGLVILPPIAEELLFRGYLFGRLRARYGFWVTALVVSAVFGLIHGQWNVGIDVFILSLFLCYLREQTGSVWYGMVVHALKNGLAYFFLFIGPLIGLNLV